MNELIQHGDRGSMRFVRNARDVLVVALVAALVFQALRRVVADRYLVPTDSMQPTLYGNRDAGDIVLVDKLASARALRRYDLAVFRSPEGGTGDLVKRVVALGDDPQHCWIELRDGDLWLGPDEQHLAREVKDPCAHRDLRVPWFEWPSRNDDPVGLSMTLPPGIAAGGAIRLQPHASVEEVRGLLTRASRSGRLRAEGGAVLGERWLSTARAVDVGFLDANGLRRRDGGSVVVDDCGMDCRVDLGRTTDVFAALLLRPDLWTFRWQVATGSAELWRNGETVARHDFGASCRGARRIEFGFLDGRFFLAIDGRADACWCETRRPEWQAADAPEATPLPRNLLHLGVAGGDGIAVPRVTVFRDLFWFRERMVGAPLRSHAVFVEPGTAYLLGDNSFDSRDSRALGSVSLSAYVGRPVCVLGPWSRHRWLGR